MIETTSTELVLPHSGELIDPTDAVACAVRIEEISQLIAKASEAKRLLASVVAAEAERQGVRSIALPGGLRAQVTGGEETVYDAEAIEAGLRRAGLNEERIREIVREEVTRTVVVREANRAANANPKYAAVIKRGSTTREKPYSVQIRRR